MSHQPHNELFIAWLNDVYAMEQAFSEAQESQIEPTSDHLALQAGIKQRLEETRHHAELNRQSLEELVESPSGVKSSIATVAGKLHVIWTTFASDKASRSALIAMPAGTSGSRAATRWPRRPGALGMRTVLSGTAAPRLRRT